MYEESPGEIDFGSSQRERFELASVRVIGSQRQLKAPGNGFLGSVKRSVRQTMYNRCLFPSQINFQKRPHAIMISVMITVVLETMMNMVIMMMVMLVRVMLKKMRMLIMLMMTTTTKTCTTPANSKKILRETILPRQSNVRRVVIIKGCLQLTCRLIILEMKADNYLAI